MYSCHQKLKLKDKQIFNDHQKLLNNSDSKKHAHMINQIHRLKQTQKNQYSALNLGKYKITSQTTANKDAHKIQITHSQAIKNRNPHIINRFDVQFKKCDNLSMQSSQKIILKEIKHVFSSISRPKKLDELFEGIDIDEYKQTPRKKAKSVMKRPVIQIEDNVFLTSNNEEIKEEVDFHLPTIYKSRTR